MKTAGPGRYTVKGDTLTLNIDRWKQPETRTRKSPARFTFRWSRYRDQLTFRAVPGKISPEPLRQAVAAYRRRALTAGQSLGISAISRVPPPGGLST